jgi:23S rRNA U2552 (ribose-2'-O)-methylase RlmE/FtsJ
MRSEGEEGTMVVKILQSGEADQWRRTVLQKAFKSVKVVKPTASRAESREQYIVARGLRAA